MKSKVLLVFPNHYQYSEWKWIPTSQVFLAATLKDAGFNPQLIDDRFSREQTIHQLEELLPGTLMVGISSATGSQLRNARQLARTIKDMADVPIVFGGSFPSAKPNFLMEQDESVDYVIVGQGEKSIISLAESIKEQPSGNSLDRIPNLWYREKGGRSVRSKAVPERYCLDTLPSLPYFDNNFIDLKGYINPATKALNYTTSVGCVGGCGFCYWHPTYFYDRFSNQRVIEDLSKMKDKFDILNLNFDDPTFFVNRKKVMDLVQDIISNRLNLKWRANGRVDTMKFFSIEDMQAVKEAGCEVIHIGLEHVSPRILELMDKKINPEDSLRLLTMSKKTGIKVRFHLLLGNPTETLDDLRQVGNFISRMQQINEEFDYTINWFTPYPGCKMTEIAKQYGYNEPEVLPGFEKMELINYTNLPDDDRLIVKESSPWDIDYKVQWFNDDENRLYLDMFRQIIPRREEFMTTGGKIESSYQINHLSLPSPVLKQ